MSVVRFQKCIFVIWFKEHDMGPILETMTFGEYYGFVMVLFELFAYKTSSFLFSFVHIKWTMLLHLKLVRDTGFVDTHIETELCSN